MAEFVRLDPADNVVTALRPMQAGIPVEGVTTTGLIPRGHKIATRAIARGEKVIKYNQIIGYAATDIAPGEHVHTQNVEFRGTAHDYEFSTVEAGTRIQLTSSCEGDNWFWRAIARVLEWTMRLADRKQLEALDKLVRATTGSGT